MRRLVGAGVVVALLVAGTGVATAVRGAASTDAAAATLLRDSVGMYPRAIRLQHSGTANGRIIASVVTFSGGNGQAAIYESVDAGASFAQVGTIAPPGSANNGGLCCGSLFELPRPVGGLAAGTLLWAGSVGARVTDRRMSLQVWASRDVGRTWSYLSSCATATNTGGLWEPELSVDASGRLVCHFSDETQQPAHNQVIARTRSTDGRTWSGRTNTVAAGVASLRPGMPVVRRLPDGSYYMVYELCPAASQYGCAAYSRTSADGWNWGSAGSLGTRVQTSAGRYFAHTPTIAWASGPTANGRLLLVGQVYSNADGSVAAGNGRTILVNTQNGSGRWSEAPAPVAVPGARNDVCPNYSSTLVPSADGGEVLEIATDYASDGICKPYFATGPLG